MVDELALQAVPEERFLVVAATQAQMATVEELREAWQHITPKAMQFLKFRLLTTTDAAARHLMGHPREDESDRACACGERKPGWIDLRETTMHDWKRNKHFMALYNAQLQQPVLHAATRLEGLAPAAVQAYEKLLDPMNEVRDSTVRNAAKDVLEAVGLKQTVGVNVKHNAVVNAESLQFRMARDRYARGVELSPMQRAMLIEAGVMSATAEHAYEARVIEPGESERTLDGDDVPVIWRDGGDENENYLPD